MDIEVPDEVALAIEQLAEATPQKIQWDLGRWIRNWEMLADELGAYGGSVADEYMNDVGARDLIHLILSQAHDAEAVVILEWALPLVESIDATFIVKTSPDTEGFIWGKYLEPHAWWRRRVPNDEGLLEGFRTSSAERRSSSYDPGTLGS